VCLSLGSLSRDACDPAGSRQGRRRQQGGRVGVGRLGVSELKARNTQPPTAICAGYHGRNMTSRQSASESADCFLHRIYTSWETAALAHWLSKRVDMGDRIEEPPASKACSRANSKARKMAPKLNSRNDPPVSPASWRTVRAWPVAGRPRAPTPPPPHRRTPPPGATRRPPRTGGGPSRGWGPVG
jgi:hypothetical protein